MRFYVRIFLIFKDIYDIKRLWNGISSNNCDQNFSETILRNVSFFSESVALIPSITISSLLHRNCNIDDLATLIHRTPGQMPLLNPSRICFPAPSDTTSLKVSYSSAIQLLCFITATTLGYLSEEWLLLGKRSCYNRQYSRQKRPNLYINQKKNVLLFDIIHIKHHTSNKITTSNYKSTN